MEFTECIGALSPLPLQPITLFIEKSKYADPLF